jgi:cysteamine dioxygenase
MSLALLNVVSLSLKAFKISSTIVGQVQVEVSTIKSASSYTSLCNLVKQLSMKDLNFTLVDDLNEKLNEFNKCYNANLGKPSAFKHKGLTQFIRSRYTSSSTQQEQLRMRNLLVYLNGEAPVLCMSLYNEPVLTLNIFLIRKGSSIPLHNHPHMHGILKVLHGSGTITCFTPLNTDLAGGILSRPEFLQKKVSSAEEDLLVLNPTDCNVHEINASEDEDLIFFDVIAPSYEANCDYYELLPVSNNSQKSVYLKKTEAPPSYFCDTLFFDGDNST